MVRPGDSIRLMDVLRSNPLLRQRTMHTALEESHGGQEFAAWYAFGMVHWRDPDSMQPLDAWLDRNDELNNELLWNIVSENRELIRSLAAY